MQTLDTEIGTATALVLDPDTAWCSIVAAMLHNFGVVAVEQCRSLTEASTRLEAAPYDIVVCADVLPYVTAREIRRGLAWISDNLSGVAYLHAMTVADSFIGDRRDFIRRSPAQYERLFAGAGLRRIGPHLYAGAELLPTLAALEGPLAPDVTRSAR